MYNSVSGLLAGLCVSLSQVSISFADDAAGRLFFNNAGTERTASAARYVFARTAANADVVRSRLVHWDKGALFSAQTPGTRLSIQLFDDIGLQDFVVEKSYLTNHGSQVWTGFDATRAGSSIILVKRGDMLVGDVRAPGLPVFSISSMGDDLPQFSWVEERRSLPANWCGVTVGMFDHSIQPAVVHPARCGQERAPPRVC